MRSTRTLILFAMIVGVLAAFSCDSVDGDDHSNVTLLSVLGIR